jgi:transcriptional regulator with XRE-family HTH domain
MVYEDDQARERVQKLIHREGLSQSEFAGKIGRLQSNVSQILKGTRQIPRGFFADIMQAFPDLRKDWLLFGEGRMYESQEEPEHEHPKDTRPRLPKYVAEGHLDDYYKGDKRELCQERNVVQQFPDYEFTIILKNNRMSPKYERGDELAFKKATIIEWGNDYLLDTFEGPKFKRVFDEGDSIRCVSYNRDEYPDFLIPKNLIYGYYKCVGVLRIL